MGLWTMDSRTFETEFKTLRYDPIWVRDVCPKLAVNQSVTIWCSLKIHWIIGVFSCGGVARTGCSRTRTHAALIVNTTVLVGPTSRTSNARGSRAIQGRSQAIHSKSQAKLNKSNVTLNKKLYSLKQKRSNTQAPGRERNEI